ncbi:MAG TPA: hypothetical protein VGM90_36700 [Kofleriaceae bacterium]|jgi:hypothetical protein
MNAFKLTVLLGATLAIAACGKKDSAGGDKPAGDKSSSGLAWTPEGYEKMPAGCKKDLACCEDLAKGEKPDAKAEDYNLKCSGPALWSEADCKTDLSARLSMLEGKTVPASCK